MKLERSVDGLYEFIFERRLNEMFIFSVLPSNLIKRRKTFLKPTKSFLMKSWGLDSLASFMVECTEQVGIQWLSR